LDRRTLIAPHYGTGPSDEQAAAGAQKRPDRDPTRVASHRTRKRRELRYRNCQKMLENLRAGDLAIPPAPAKTAVLDQACIQPMDTAPSAEPRPCDEEFELLFEESDYFSEEEGTGGSDRIVYLASPPRLPPLILLEKGKRKRRATEAAWTCGHLAPNQLVGHGVKKTKRNIECFSWLTENERSVKSLPAVARRALRGPKKIRQYPPDRSFRPTDVEVCHLKGHGN